MSADPTAIARVGIVGARGYTGAELIRVVLDHPRLDLAFASSRQEGRPIADVVPGAPDHLRFRRIDVADLAADTPDVVVLALPDGAGRAFLGECAGAGIDPPCVVDLSADHRFDDTWTYGLPERTGASLAGATRIANPGCYATAMQLALGPLLPHLDGTPTCFGVSGCSGAGSTPSPRNDPERLRDNVMPYALVDHTHEREVSRHLGRAVRFAPSVASFFRGIILTAVFDLRAPTTAEAIVADVERAYADEPFVRVIGAEVPLLCDVTGQDHAIVGGITLDAADGRRGAIVCAIDNLRKGAATQAVQNINLALGFGPTEGLTPCISRCG